MKRIWLLMPLFLCLCASAKAQETPHWEVAGGYTYVDANFQPSYSSRFTLNGGNLSLAENANSWFGARFEFSALGGTEGGVNVNAQTYTFGPVFSYRRFERVTPYAHAQFGVIRATAGYLGISEAANKLDITGGGGVDFAINRRAAVRFQGDYLMTRFLTLRQNNLQLSVGLVLRFGHK